MNSYINIGKREERNRELFFRCKTMNKEFEWNEQNVESLLRLNDVLTKLMAKARKQHNAIVRDINKLLADGKKYYKDFHVETHVYYDFDGKEYKLFGIDCTDYFAEQLRLGWNAAPFSKKMDELSWNIETLNHPSLKEHKICYLMHVIFAHAKFPLQYGIQLNPKKIGFISKIHI